MKTDQDSESTESNAEGNSLPSTKAARFLTQAKVMGKIILNYVLDGFAPVAAVAALIFSVMVFNTMYANQSRLENAKTRINNLNASLKAYKVELEKLKAEMAKQYLMQVERNRKLDELDVRIVQSVSRLQKKMKISPTLEVELQPEFGNPSTPSADAAAANIQVHPAQSTILSKNSTTTGSNKKSGEGIDTLKDAINKFNRK